MGDVLQKASPPFTSAVSSPCGLARDWPRWDVPARPVPERAGPVAATGRATGLRASPVWRRSCRRHSGWCTPGRLPDRNPVLDGRSGRCPPRRRPDRPFLPGTCRPRLKAWRPRLPGPTGEQPPGGPTAARPPGAGSLPCSPASPPPRASAARPTLLTPRTPGQAAKHENDFPAGHLDAGRSPDPVQERSASLNFY